MQLYAIMSKAILLQHGMKVVNAAPPARSYFPDSATSLEIRSMKKKGGPGGLVRKKYLVEYAVAQQTPP